MKKFWKILIPILLLALLLIGGNMLYRQLAPRVQQMAEEAGSVTPVPRHQGEYTESEPEPAADLTEAPLVEMTADFSVLDETGSYVSLSDFFGQPIVVNVWATWCPPCRAELPYFDSAAKKYEGQVSFLMIDLTDGATDTVESATAFAREENGYGFPLYFDVDFSAAEAYQINAIPVTLFIRADGSLLHQQIGAMDEATLESYIQQLLSES